MWGLGILNGLRLTMRNFLRGPITVRYPYEKVELPERARWAVTPLYDEEGAPRCTACMACVRACPDHILDLEFTTGEEKRKHIEHFSYELGACMMCGLCVEACPFDAIGMGHDYELARRTAAELTYDLLADVDAALVRRPAQAAAKKERSADAGEGPAAGAGPGPASDATHGVEPEEGTDG